ncbi:hypothetical protein GT347_22995 [Xylophilus rhododendri]|uniref:Uncharacterized protein n=1 Tax=Xylophilus rhododendri TaxID=2697032 RepID=A0A857JBJ5_9BURK|nr:hypothetical protein [Xylophilus rhododendri]QHJ00594.1 hypothetical protein GT347_22995 [Xylophilus rhododendri]
MAEKVRIVLPDTGPLITLAHADALDVLLAFDPQQVQLVITDMVEFEATRQRDAREDAQRIASFIARHAGRILIETTSFGRMAISAARTYERYAQSQQVRDFYAASDMPPPAPLARNSGELSINSYVSELIGQAPGPPCLVIAEDDFFLRSTPGAMPGNAHIISTGALLAKIEALNPRISARGILDAAKRYKGRDPKRDLVDSPAAKVKAGSSWAEVLDDASVASLSPGKPGLRKRQPKDLPAR